MRTLILAATVCLISANAQAHAFLMKAEPPVGATVDRLPAAVRLEFSEPLELAFSGVEMTNGSGAVVTLKGQRFGDAAHKVMMADLPALPPGAYHLKWHVVSVDTHRTDGDFSFTVKP